MQWRRIHITTKENRELDLPFYFVAANIPTCLFADPRRGPGAHFLPDVVSGGVNRRELQPKGSLSPAMAGGTTPQAWQVRACRSPPRPIDIYIYIN